jgi:hypothetical protein
MSEMSSLLQRKLIYFSGGAFSCTAFQRRRRVLPDVQIETKDSKDPARKKIEIKWQEDE